MIVTARVTFENGQSRLKGSWRTRLRLYGVTISVRRWATKSAHRRATGTIASSPRTPGPGGCCLLDGADRMGVDHHLTLLGLEQKRVDVERPDTASEAGSAQEIDVNGESFTSVSVELKELATLRIGRDFQGRMPPQWLECSPIVDGP